ncbi:MAG: hypothetical protein GW948_02140 [Rhodobacterales bacterium]|nr:hypothetical protein [Rhodobacterales bacterium]
MASPAEVANDMAAQARYWDRRDPWIEATCRNAASVIRAYLSGEKVDGRTLRGCLDRLFRIESTVRHQSKPHTYNSLVRARETIINLRNEATK